MSIKRRFDEATAETPADGLFEIRVLIGKYDASVIIGRGGDNVKNIRIQTKCYVSVKSVPSQAVKERILTVKGLPENISRAMFMIAQLLVDASQGKPKKGENPGEATFKILVHKFIVGCVLGKGGEIVKAIQEQTKARVALSNDPLPGSTEKTVSITGTPEVIHLASERIVQQLVQTPLRPGSVVTPYVPSLASFVPTNPAFAAAAPAAAFGFPGAQGFGAFGLGDNRVQTEKIVIPSECGSMLIGKGGSVISEIRAQSGTQISLHKPAPTAPKDQIVSITGTPAGIQAALFLIRQRVESYERPPEQAVA